MLVVIARSREVGVAARLVGAVDPRAHAQVHDQARGHGLEVDLEAQVLLAGRELAVARGGVRCGPLGVGPGGVADDVAGLDRRGGHGVAEVVVVGDVGARHDVLVALQARLGVVVRVVVGTVVVPVVALGRVVGVGAGDLVHDAPVVDDLVDLALAVTVDSVDDRLVGVGLGGRIDRVIAVRVLGLGLPHGV